MAQSTTRAKKGFDLKKDWPIVAAGGGAVLGYLFLSSNSNSSSGSYIVGTAPAGSTTPSTSSPSTTSPTSIDPGVVSLISNAMSLDAQNQQEQDQLAAIDTQAENSAYTSYLQLENSEYGASQQLLAIGDQESAATTIANSQKPSFLQQLGGVITSAVPLFTGTGALSNIFGTANKPAAAAPAAAAPAYGGTNIIFGGLTPSTTIGSSSALQGLV